MRSKFGASLDLLFFLFSPPMGELEEEEELGAAKNRALERGAEEP